MNSEQKISLWQRLVGEPMKLHEKIVAILFILIFLIAFYLTLDANKYQAQVRVIAGEGKVGINPTTLALDFGDLSRGTAAVRRVSIQNGTGIPLWIASFKLGGISDLMDADKNYFIIKPGGEDKIEYTVYMPASAEIDRLYTGRVFIFRIPAPWAR
jgi:hypothetical protein